MSKRMSDQRHRKIHNVLETCFSDANLLWDKLMLHHMSNDNGGFVSFKTLSRFPKFKTLGATPEEIKESAELYSLEKLKINSEGTSIARINPYTANKKKEDDSKSIYVEGLARSYQNDTKIKELFEKHVGPVQCIRIPETRSKTEAFLGFCFVEFSREEDADRAVQIMNDNAELTKSKLRVMTKLRWNEYEQEYLKHQEKQKERIKYLWRQDYHKDEKTKNKTNDEGFAKKPKLESSLTFKKGVIALVQNIHPNSSKTTAIELLQTSGVQIEFMANKKKGLDRAHVRLGNSEDAQQLEEYFQGNPTIQETEKDKIGTASAEHDISTLKVRVLQGREEEIYWENDLKAK
ncbi:hypothetical protein BY458DRAFT_497296 [Sporodiniella umbellata]|nr:hypothetical protein BY458DRAFT_497296 [Sporodiniella umbellata]